MTEAEIVSGTVVCGGCGFVVQIDGGLTEEEVQTVCLEITRIHGRQRHNDTTESQTSIEWHSYEQETPDRLN